MRVLCDEIEWDVAEGTDVTYLPVLDVINISDEVYDQDDFWVACYAALSKKYKTDVFGLSYQILEGTIH